MTTKLARAEKRRGGDRGRGPRMRIDGGQIPSLSYPCFALSLLQLSDANILDGDEMMMMTRLLSNFFSLEKEKKYSSIE